MAIAIAIAVTVIVTVAIQIHAIGHSLLKGSGGGWSGGGRRAVDVDETHDVGTDCVIGIKTGFANN